MKKLLIITGILILGAGIYGIYEFSRGHESNANAKSDVTISANELLTAFQTGEEEANAKYNDKVIEVTGEVREATQTDGKTIVRLDAGDSMAGVTCELDDQAKHKRTDFKTGDPVTFKCTCTGILMDVVLVRCVEK
ncbi:MAG: hypothetical protein IPM82_22320 [Saprospiraceae bacterium]|nr:hypothetical protein [Saprospiraceae bacterium]